LTFHAAAKLGATRIVNSLSIGALTLVLTAIVAALAAFIVFGQYARKESVEGFLEPDHGVIRVFPQRGGVISDMRVTAGQSVQRDDVLFKVADLQTLADGTDADALLLQQFASDGATLAAARERQAGRFTAQRSGLIAQRATVVEQITQIDQLADVQIEQAALAAEQLDALRRLHDRGMLATIEWLARREQHLQLGEKLRSTRQQRSRLNGEQNALDAQLRQLPIEHAERLADIDTRLSALERSVVQVRARRNFDVRSPVAGRVISLQRKVGETAAPGDAAMTIIPNNSTLVGRLLIPTSAIGFVAPGQTVRIRFDAFPYQHFGVFPAVIREVARGVLFSGDGYGPLQVTHPAYPATVALESQTVATSDAAVPLRSGMLFSADIILERRSILEWVFEPLLVMRGRG